MLLEYSIENFKSILIEEKISLIARPFKNKKATSIHLLNNSILPYVGIYGPNGGGKTSFLESLGFLLSVACSGRETIDCIMKTLVSNKNKLAQNKPTIWNLKIMSNQGNVFIYSISATDEIIYEKLSLIESVDSIKERKLFEVEKNKVLYLSEEIPVGKDKLLNKGTSILYFLFNLDISNLINEFFNTLKSIKYIDSSVELSNIQMPGTLLSEYPLYISEIIKNKKSYLEIFSDLDLNIVDIKIVKKANNERFLITKKGQLSKKYDIDFEDESTGTKKIIKLLSILVQAIHNKTTLLIAKIDCQLHPLLLGYIIKMFANENNNGGQIIFSSHDLITLDSEYFRKDQIYFAALNEGFFTNVVCMNDFGSAIREGNSFAKKYLEGELGYDPNVNFDMKWLSNLSKNKR